MAHFQWLITRTKASLHLLCRFQYIYVCVCGFSLSFLLFATNFQCQSATVSYQESTYHLLSVTVRHAFSVVLSFNCKYPLPYTELFFFTIHFEYCVPIECVDL